MAKTEAYNLPHPSGLLGFDLTDIRKVDEDKWELSFDVLFARKMVKLKQIGILTDITT